MFRFYELTNKKELLRVYKKVNYELGVYEASWESTLDKDARVVLAADFLEFLFSINKKYDICDASGLLKRVAKADNTTEVLYLSVIIFSDLILRNLEDLF